jgi:hypothetical protein
MISWGERLPNDAPHEDRFPHSEGWLIEPTGKGTCLVRNHLRGRHLFPLSAIIGKQLWEPMSRLVFGRISSRVIDAQNANGTMRADKKGSR